MRPLLAPAGDSDPQSRSALGESAHAGTTNFYEGNAEGYARSTRTHDMGPQLERFLPGLPPNAQVLDLGCGGGRDLNALRAAGHRPIGLEISPRLAAIAEAFSDCPVVVGDIRAPHFEAGTFDGIWASASLLHLGRTDLPGTLRRLHDLLRPGGKLFASVKAGVGEECAPDGRWFTYFDPAEWHGLLSSAGFCNIDVEVEVGLAQPAATGVRRPWIQSFASVP